MIPASDPATPTRAAAREPGTAREWAGLGLLFGACFALATLLAARSARWAADGTRDGGIVAVLLGDSQRLVARHFFVQADVYFHGGHYPSIFDEPVKHEERHVADRPAEVGLETGAGEHDDHAQGEELPSFLPPPRDWLERFGRQFFPSTHAHLEQVGEARELLPWLRMSTSLDPHREESYVVGAHWLRTRLQRPLEAARFLLEGWRDNPDSFEIVLELGRVYDENLGDPARARNLYELALRQWHAREDTRREPDFWTYRQILACLALLEERQGRLPAAIERLAEVKKHSPHPDLVQKRIDALREKSNRPPPPPRPLTSP